MIKSNKAVNKNAKFLEEISKVFASYEKSALLTEPSGEAAYENIV